MLSIGNGARISMESRINSMGTNLLFITPGATSTDGVQWQRVSEQPFLPNGQPGSWNACESGHPFAFTDEDGSVTLFYQGDSDMGKSWYLSSRKIGWVNDLPVLL